MNKIYRILAVSLIGILTMSCEKKTITQDLTLKVKTPFKKGTVSVTQDGSTVVTTDIPVDSSCYIVLYAVPEESSFSTVITRSSHDTGVGHAHLIWTFGGNTKIENLFFDSLHFALVAKY